MGKLFQFEKLCACEHASCARDDGVCGRRGNCLRHLFTCRMHKSFVNCCRFLIVLQTFFDHVNFKIVFTIARVIWGFWPSCCTWLALEWLHLVFCILHYLHIIFYCVPWLSCALWLIWYSSWIIYDLWSRNAHFACSCSGGWLWRHCSVLLEASFWNKYLIRCI